MLEGRAGSLVSDASHFVVSTTGFLHDMDRVIANPHGYAPVGYAKTLQRAVERVMDG